MRKATLMAVAAAGILMSSSAFAAPYRHHRYDPVAPAAVGTGAVVGTVAGVGAYNTWFGSSVAATALPTTAAGAVAVGGIAGIGTVVLIGAATEPCGGFHALFGMNKDACVDGHYVGPGNAPQARVWR